MKFAFLRGSRTLNLKYTFSSLRAKNPRLYGFEQFNLQSNRQGEPTEPKGVETRASGTRGERDAGEERSPSSRLHVLHDIDTLPPLSYTRAAFSLVAVPVADATAVANHPPMRRWLWKEPPQCCTPVLSPLSCLDQCQTSPIQTRFLVRPQLLTRA